jgi:hypothetical protein
MSHGRRPNVSDERIYISPSERRQAMLEVIAGAKRRLVLSLFRCNDFGVLDGLASALDRGVKVEAPSSIAMPTRWSSITPSISSLMARRRWWRR